MLDDHCNHPGLVRSIRNQLDRRFSKTGEGKRGEDRQGLTRGMMREAGNIVEALAAETEVEIDLDDDAA